MSQSNSSQATAASPFVTSAAAQQQHPQQPPPAPSVIRDAQDAILTLDALRRTVGQLESLLQNATTSLTCEQDYVQQVLPQLEQATSQYQTLASFLQESKKNAHDKQTRTIQREFVATMSQLQQLQRDAAQTRETLCDADFLAQARVSKEDLQSAKEEVREAQVIASEAVVVKQLFQQVGTLVHEQGRGIQEIEAKVDKVVVEIGTGVNELQQAVRLQREARQKYCVYFWCLLLLLVAITTPLVIVFK